MKVTEQVEVAVMVSLFSEDVLFESLPGQSFIMTEIFRGYPPGKYRGSTSIRRRRFPYKSSFVIPHSTL
jgi:hypothetical protein